MDARKRQEKRKRSLVLGGDLQRKGRLESETAEGGATRRPPCTRQRVADGLPDSRFILLPPRNRHLQEAHWASDTKLSGNQHTPL